MIFRQLFDSTSSTYTYLIANRVGGEALIVDPVLDRVDHYLRLLRELDIRLMKAVDTHVHADHVTALGALRDTTRCVTVMGEKARVDVVSVRVAEGDTIDIDGLSLDVIYTPGHTDCSYSFLMADRVFTGDTLLIRGTGRTDFQNGDARAQYESLFGKLLKLPGETLVYPAHDYKGDSVSTIAEERAFNPRLQVAGVDEYVDLMASLDLPNPKMMDVAVPKNLAIGYRSDDAWLGAHTLSARACRDLGDDAVFVDLRESGERERHGRIPGARHVPFATIADAVSPSGPLSNAAADGGRNLLLFCAHGERSALALEKLHERGITDARHMAGGIAAWKDAGGDIA